ncbi:MAG: hypothetical protein KDD58_09255 [Bdellovibrionales bacterium]|nr:hypothetical protein [Bdellovibrionales bacterium]
MRFYDSLKCTCLTVLTIVSLSNSVQADIKEKAEKAVADLKVNFDLSPVDLDLGNVLNIKGNYEFEVDKQDSTLKTYPRSDMWTLRENLGPSFNFDEGLSLGFGIAKGTEVEFIRQFPTKKEALKAIPYSLNRIPLNAEIVRDKLESNDFVRFSADLTIRASAGVAKSFGILNLSANGYYLIRGTFQIHVYKLPNGKVLLRAFAEKRRTQGAGLTAKIKPTLEVFSIDKANDLAEGVLKATPIKFSLAKYKGQLFMVEYLFDIENKAGFEAYDQLLSATRTNLRDYKIVLKDGEELRSNLIANLDAIEEEISRENSLEENQRAVMRLTRAQSDFMGKVVNTEFKMYIAQWKRNKNFNSQKITFVDKNNKSHHYVFATYLDLKSKGIDLGFAELELERPRYADALLKLDDKGDEVVELLHLGFSFERHERTQTQREIDQFKNRLKGTLTGGLYNKIDLGSWKNSKFFRSGGVNVSASLVVSGDALDLLKRDVTNLELLKKAIEKHVQNISEFRTLTGGVTTRFSDDQYPLDTTTEMFFADINEISNSLYSSFTGLSLNQIPISNKQRWEQFLSLLSNQLFKQIGPGLIMRLLEEPQLNHMGATTEELEKLVSIKLNMEAPGEDKIIVNIGRERSSILGEQYEQLRTIRNILSTQSFNKRFLSE